MLRVHRGTLDVVEESMQAVATASAEVLEKLGQGARRTAWVAGTTVALMAMIVGAAALWFLSRAVANRIAHLRNGKSAAHAAQLVQLVGLV